MSAHCVIESPLFTTTPLISGVSLSRYRKMYGGSFMSATLFKEVNYSLAKLIQDIEFGERAER
jgi:hypothetical protein